MVLLVRVPLILFDGVCNLCNAWVRFVVRRDPTGIFRFAAQQSSTGQQIIIEYVSGAGQLSTVILIEDNAIYTESDAVPPNPCSARLALVLDCILTDYPPSSP
jgi:predicted DCC family thiol-disulfide oxidoreductase YuxK